MQVRRCLLHWRQGSSQTQSPASNRWRFASHGVFSLPFDPGDGWMNTYTYSLSWHWHIAIMIWRDTATGRCQLRWPDTITNAVFGRVRLIETCLVWRSYSDVFLWRSGVDAILLILLVPWRILGSLLHCAVAWTWRISNSAN